MAIQIGQEAPRLEPDAVFQDPVATGVTESGPAVPAPRSVVLYCRPGCIDCRLSRRFLERNGIAFTEINVRADPEAEAQVKAWTGGQLISPVFDIDGTIVIDFERSELMRVLDLD